ncbi:MAG: alpha/beta hydrolase [Actinomycetota bacterium]
MPVHPDAQKFLDIVAGAPPLDTQSVEQNRSDLANALPLTGIKTEIKMVQDFSIAGVPVRVYRPEEATQPTPVVVYFHGGGWVIGDLEIADTTVRDLAVASQATVVSVDYRKAPETVFPGAVEDALAVVRNILNGGVVGLNIDVQRVAVAGDSAGGNLAAVVAQQLRGHQPPLVHQVLVYPVTDLASIDTDSYREYADGYFLTARDMAYFAATYASGADRSDPRLSPLRNPDLSDLPSATVVTAECDPLRDEGEAYARAMALAGTTVTAVRFNGQVHPFLYMGGLIGDAHAARQFIGSQVRAAFTTAGEQSSRIGLLNADAAEI